MGSSYGDRSRAVADALVASYRRYLEGELRRRNIDPAEVAASVDDGEAALRRTLDAWASQPASSQRATPMELFREALAAPTQALQDLGLAPVERDRSMEQVLPGDAYDLAPAGAAELGAEAGRAVAAWGVARAEVVAGVVPAAVPPRAAVALVGTDLLDRARIAAAAEAAGLELAVWRNPAAIEAGLGAGAPGLALVDLTHPEAVDAVARLAAAGSVVVAFGPHVDDAALERAVAAGASEALPRSRFFPRLGALLSERA